MVLRLQDIELMLATPGSPFTRPGWIYELKYDGFRLLAAVNGGRAQLRYRGGRDATLAFPEMVAALEKLRVRDAVLDGELVVLEPNGHPSFERLQRRFVRRAAAREIVEQHPCTLFAFDLLAVNGRDLRQLPLLERKAELVKLLRKADAARVRYVDHVEENGEAFLTEVARLGLEGVVAKRAESKYAGGRSRSWLKWPVHRTARLAVVGFTRPGYTRIGGLHVARASKGGLVYAGKVGFGFAGGALAAIRARLQAIECGSAPCRKAPQGSGHVWVKPVVVCQVRFKEWTSGGALRQPVFVGFRPGESVDPE